MNLLMRLGVVMLDLDATDLTAIATHVVDQLVLSGQLPPDCKGHVLKALLLKHRYATTADFFTVYEKSMMAEKSPLLLCK